MITNKHNLPEPLYQAICNVNAKYNPGDSDITVTQLIDSPRIRILRKQHKDEIREDASDMIWRFFGSVSHQILQEQCGFNKLIEERLYIEVYGWKIGGQLDLYKDNKLSDYKITSKYTVKNGVKKEWGWQIKLLAYILTLNGFKVNHAEIVAILRDAGKDDDKVVVLPVRWDLVDIDETEKYLIERLMLHKEAEVNLPLCTEGERWYSPGKFAVYKNKNKRALKLFDTLQESKDFKKANDNWDDMTIIERKGENKRCMTYCDVAQFCDWWLGQKK